VCCRAFTYALARLSCDEYAEIAELDIARSDNAAPDSRGGQRETGQRETK